MGVTRCCIWEEEVSYPVHSKKRDNSRLCLDDGMYRTYDNDLVVHIANKV